jgi:hypothetical protein
MDWIYKISSMFSFYTSKFPFPIIVVVHHDQIQKN